MTGKSEVSARRHSIIYNSDTTTIFRRPGGHEILSRSDLALMIDEVAATHVDVFSSVVVDRWQCWYDSSAFEVPSLSQGSTDTLPMLLMIENLHRLIAGGNDPLRVMLDRAHEQGMKFLAAFRMNDMHALSPENPIYGQFRLQHLDWRLRDESGQTYAGLDYEHPEVNELTRAIAQEILEAYDVDGLELDFMRHPWYFQKGREEIGAGRITNLVCHIRAMLDMGPEKKRRLLSVRIPASPCKCRAIGLDVEQWIERNLVDYICPSDYFFTDFKIPIQEWRDLIAAHPVGLYPSLHPFAAHAIGSSPFRHAEILDADTQKTVANLFYEQGADGMSVYNWFVPREYQNAPEMDFQTLRIIGDPVACAALPQLYRFYPLWGPSPEMGPTRRCQAYPATARHDMIVLKRTQPGASGVLQFPLASNTNWAAAKGRISFKIENHTPEDVLLFRINGFECSPDTFELRHYPAGRNGGLGARLSSYAEFSAPFDHVPLQGGINEFCVILEKARPDIPVPLVISELFVDVI